MSKFGNIWKSTSKQKSLEQLKSYIELLNKVRREEKRVSDERHQAWINRSEEEKQKDKESLLQVIRKGIPTVLKGELATLDAMPKPKGASPFKIEFVSAEEHLKEERDRDANAKNLKYRKCSKKMSNLEHWGHTIEILEYFKDGSVLCKYSDIRLLSGTGGYFKFKNGRVTHYVIVRRS